MSEKDVPEKEQSGAKVALGILAFIVGLLLLLWLLKLVFGI